ncbi:MAG: sigma-54 dependent transcriptional regulator [Pseudomonadota bacterium]
MTSSGARILVIDDEPDLRTLYELTLLREGYGVEAAESVASARLLLANSSFDAVITDMRLPDGSGLDVLRALAQQGRSERCVMITAYGSPENAVEALKAGAFDYLTKPVDLKQFRSVVASAIEQGRAPRANTRRPVPGKPRGEAPAENSAEAGHMALQRLVGGSEAMRVVKARIARVAGSMAPVMVCGESGTGKELVARAVHACSHRSAGPFVAVNCSAIPENLLEAEFFGARKGAYTGSVQDREGYFQAAGGGTLFLDEVGDLPLAMQAKLLRAIQERSVRPVGSTQEEPTDVRIVSATHKDLEAEVQNGRFRQDLYYRLNVIDIDLPPLRERREDIPALCTALLQKISAESGTVFRPLGPRMQEQLLRHGFTGNVRELENLLHRAMALGDDAGLQLDLPAPIAVCADTVELPANPTAAPAAQPLLRMHVGSLPSDLQAYLDQQERAILLQALRDSQFNRTSAAARLGLSLRQMRYRIARLNIAMPQGDDTGNGTD